MVNREAIPIAFKICVSRGAAKFVSLVHVASTPHEAAAESEGWGWHVLPQRNSRGGECYWVGGVGCMARRTLTSKVMGCTTNLPSIGSPLRWVERVCDCWWLWIGFCSVEMFNLAFYGNVLIAEISTSIWMQSLQSPSIIPKLQWLDLRVWCSSGVLRCCPSILSSKWDSSIVGCSIS